MQHGSDSSRGYDEEIDLQDVGSQFAGDSRGAIHTQSEEYKKFGFLLDGVQDNSEEGQVIPDGPVQIDETQPVKVGIKFKDILLLLLCQLFWGTSVWFISYNTELSPSQKASNGTFTVQESFGFLATVLVFFLLAAIVRRPVPFGKLHWWPMMASGVGMAFIIGSVGYIELIKSSGQDGSILGPLAGLYVLIPAILGFIVFKEPLNWLKGMGILLASAGIIILSMDLDNAKENGLGVNGKTIGWLIFCLACWGGGTFLAIVVSRRQSAGEQFGIVFLSHALGRFIAGFVASYSCLDQVKYEATFGSLVGFAAGALSAMGNIVFYYLSHGGMGASLISPLSGLYVLWPVIFSLAFSHASFGPWKAVGIFIAASAI